MTAVRIASTEIVRVNYGESTATMTAVRTASTEIVRVKQCINRNDSGTYCINRKSASKIRRPTATTAVRIASTDIVRMKYGASTKFLGKSPEMETYFAVTIIITIIIIINLQNCVKS
jgi:type IV secretory pathway component VirB8